MNLIKHTDYIYEYQNFISDDICNKIISNIEFSNISRDIWNKSRNNIRNNVSLNLTSYRLYCNHIKESDNISHAVFSEVHKQYILDCKLMCFMLKRHHMHNFISEYTYRCYDKDDFYDWHIDDDEGQKNIISYLWYLNDDFTGGNLLFLNDKISITPKKGSILCFPCGFQWIHKSAKILSGNKKIVWTCFFREE